MTSMTEIYSSADFNSLTRAQLYKDLAEGATMHCKGLHGGTFALLIYIYILLLLMKAISVGTHL